MNFIVRFKCVQIKALICKGKKQINIYFIELLLINMDVVFSLGIQTLNAKS